MTRIVTPHYRYKPPPRKWKAVALTGPAVVTRRTAKPEAEPAAVTAPPPANDDGKPALEQPAIVTARRPGKQYADAPDLTPEEHQRRGDAAAALWREVVRRVREKP